MSIASSKAAKVTSTIEENSAPVLSLRTNFCWTLSGNVIYSGCQWGVLVILAKLGSPTLLGRFALALAVTAPVILFANLQLRAVQATDAKHEFLFGDYLGLRLSALLAAMLTIAIIAFQSGYHLETILVILVVGIAKVFESVSDIFFGLFQQQERMDIIAKSMTIKGLLSLIALGAGVYLAQNLIWGAIGLAISWMLVLVFYDLPRGVSILRCLPHALKSESSSEDLADCNQGNRRALKMNMAGLKIASPRWNKARLVELAWLALPLGFVMLLISLNSNIPRYFVEHYLGERELGIFAALLYLMVAGTTVIGALGQSASPKLAKYFSQGDRMAFSNLTYKLVMVGMLMGVFGVVIVAIAGKELISLLYKPEYAQRMDVLIWLMIAAGINYVASFLGYAMTAARYFKSQTPLFFLVIAVLTIASFLLIPTYGLLGSVIALVIAAIVQVIGSLVILLHVFRASIDSNKEPHDDLRDEIIEEATDEGTKELIAHG